MFLSLMPYIVSDFSHNIPKLRNSSSDIQRDRHERSGGQVEAGSLETGVLNTCGSRDRPALATRGRSVPASSYSQASRVGVGLRARRNGTAPASGAEVQHDLEAPNLEMTHTSGKIL